MASPSVDLREGRSRTCRLDGAERVFSRLLFLAIIAVELVHTATAVLQHRVPSGHDGFQYFTIQYYFLNNAIQGNEVAQWIPYMTQGTVGTFWYAIQGSFLQNVLLCVPWLLRNADLMVIYHVGMFVDELILLTGTWLLARRFFRTPAVFFIAVSVVGSCVWLDQPYWNFRLYYAIPLTLELAHRFLESSRWRWFFLAANLLALQSIGNLPYFLPLASFVVFAYFALYAATNPRLVGERLRRLRWRWQALLAIATSATSFVVAYACLTIGTEPLLNYNVGRNRDGTTDLVTFLTYGGAPDLRKWIDLVLNVSPWLDFTLYAGILLLPLLLCGLLAADRRRVHFVLLALTLLLFTLGTFVSVALFYSWPGMRYFRHIGLVSPLVKVLFCFVAGIAFEWLFDTRGRGRATWTVRVAATTGALLLALGAWQALRISQSGPAIATYLAGLPVADVDRPLDTYEPDVLARRLGSSATVALGGAAVLGIVPLLLRSPRFARSPAARRTVLCVVLAFVGVEVYRFKFAYLGDRSDVIWSPVRFVTRPSTMTYAARREPDLSHAALTNARLRATLDFNRMLLMRVRGRIWWGAQYWTNNAFWFVDEAGSSLQADSWLEPLDQFIRMYRRRPINDTSTAPPGFDFGSLKFPLDHPAAAKISGVAEDKIRFFAHAYSVVSPDDLVPLMTDHSYMGDLLFVLPVGDASGHIPVVWASQQSLSADESLPLSYQVRHFDANNLIVEVFNPASAVVWMSYADVWHPSWHATVNGHPVPVYRANMAYKAVPIGGGENVIHFRFGSALFSKLTEILSLNAAFWLCAVAWMLSELVRAPLPAQSGVLEPSPSVLLMLLWRSACRMARSHSQPRAFDVRLQPERRRHGKNGDLTPPDAP